MIFGLSIEPGHECTCSTEEEVHLSLAAIESRSQFGEADSYYSQLILKTGTSEQLLNLCTLVHGTIFQQCLDLKLMPGEKVTFTVQGSRCVYVTGYSHSSPLVPASDEPTVEQDDIDGDDCNINDTVVKSEPDNSEYLVGGSGDEEMTNPNLCGTANNNEQDDSDALIKSEPEDSDNFNNISCDEEMTNSNLCEAATDRQEGEDFIESEESITSEKENLHGGSVGETAGPVITDEERNQSDLLNIFVNDNVIEGTVDNDGSVLHSEPGSGSIIKLKSVESSDHELNKENNLLTCNVVEDTIDNHHADIPSVRQGDTSDVIMETEKGELLNIETTSLPVTMDILPQCNLRNRRKTKASDILSPAPLAEIQEKDVLHKTLAEKTTSGNTSDKRIHTGKPPFSCKYCEKEFWDKTYFLEHESNHTGKKYLKCNHCENTFSQQRILRLHERYHTQAAEKSFKCTNCERSFACKRNLKYHERTHTGEEPFKCKHCGKSFNWISILTVHERIHTVEKSFKCNYCGEMFRHRRNWVEHEKIHTDDKQFKCKYSNCDKTFHRKRSLKIHEWVHVEEKPFPCNDCDKSFARKSILTTHERTHTGEKPFKCKICDKKYSCKKSCTNHESIHIREVNS